MIKVIFEDGGVLTGYTAEFYGTQLVVDEYRIVDICEIERIEEAEDEE